MALGRPLLASTLLLLASLAGCTTAPEEPGAEEPVEPTVLYTHQWSYGPGYQGTDALPVFEDSFRVQEGFENLTVRIVWRIDEGRAAVELTPPPGGTVNLTSEETGGPEGQGQRDVAGEPGEWGFRIPTWRGEDGSFPQGHVRVVVEGSVR